MDTTPIAVTVFLDRARVTRVGKTTLEVGQQTLLFTDLPLALVADSVRAIGRGTARAKLLGITTRMEYFTETPAEKALELEQAILKREDTDADLLARIGVLEKEGKALDHLALQSETFARGIALRGRSNDDQTQTFKALYSRLDEIESELLRIARERRTLAKELDKLRQQLKQLHAARPRQRYVAAVELEVTQAGDFEAELTYVVTGASWRPLYDVRLLNGGLDLTYLAQVQQNTAENWNGVTLTLSTAQPALSLTIPELTAWYVQPRPPMPQSPPRMRAAAAPAPMAKGAFQPAALQQAADEVSFGITGAEPEQFLEMTTEAAAVSESGASLTYSLSGRSDIPGNNEPRKVTVAQLPFKPKLDYVTAPKLQASCYRRATVKNDSPYTLLPGSVQLFEGDEYLGATSLELIAPDREFELFLGADERVTVERELTMRDVDKTFMGIGDRRRIRYGYKIELENLRDAAQQILVRDHIPVARDEQIKVKLETTEPRPTEQSDLHILEWKLTLAPKTKQVVRYEFTVEFPRTMDVIGLP